MMNYSKWSIFVLLVMGLVGQGIGTFAYAQLSSNPKAKNPCPRIDEIIRDSIKQGEREENGVKLITRTSIPSWNVEEVKSHGAEAIPCVAKHLTAKEERERRLAVDLLGRIGGAEVVGTLGTTVREDPSKTLRIAALHWLSSIDDAEAKEILKEASESNSEDKVRDEAKKILNTPKSNTP